MTASVLERAPVGSDHGRRAHAHAVVGSKRHFPQRGCVASCGHVWDYVPTVTDPDKTQRCEACVRAVETNTDVICLACVGPGDREG